MNHKHHSDLFLTQHQTDSRVQQAIVAKCVAEYQQSDIAELTRHAADLLKTAQQLRPQEILGEIAQARNKLRLSRMLLECEANKLEKCLTIDLEYLGKQVESGTTATETWLNSIMQAEEQGAQNTQATLLQLSARSERVCSEIG